MSQWALWMLTVAGACALAAVLPTAIARRVRARQLRRWARAERIREAERQAQLRRQWMDPTEYQGEPW